MNYQAIVDGTTKQNPDLMRKIVMANDVTFSECVNAIKKNKAVINFHTSTYVFQQGDLFNPVELSAALFDLKSNCEMIINKLNELK